MNSVEMIDIVKQYPLVRAVDHVSFSLGQGEIHSLLGENGAGKSTLMRLISGQTRIDRGEIRLFGKIPEKKEQRVRRRIGTLIEEPGFYTYIKFFDRFNISKINKMAQAYFKIVYID